MPGNTRAFRCPNSEWFGIMQPMISASTSDPYKTARNEPAGSDLLAKTLTENTELRQQLADVQQQLATFKKLLFGPRTEKRPFDIPGQPDLFAQPKAAPDEASATKPVKEHQRGKARKGFPDGCVNDS